MRDLLAGSAQTFFANLPAPDASEERRGWLGAPPIDEEDYAEAEYPDRTLLWTRYVRSHVSIGGKPFLDDDRYAALFTTCLASACELVLALEPAADGTIPHRVRQSTLLKALISGLAALGFDAEKRVQYITYHRDWLLRFVLPKGRQLEEDPLQKILQRFATRLAGMAPTLEILRRHGAEEWSRAGTGEGRYSRQEAVWRRALADLLEYITPFSADRSYHLDPFAADPAFSPIFKVFHSLGNQLGLHMADEAFAHHTLLQVHS
jgi:hypothetical protein